MACVNLIRSRTTAILHSFSHETDLLMNVIMKCVNIKLGCFHDILNAPRKDSTVHTSTEDNTKHKKYPTEGVKNYPACKEIKLSRDLFQMCSETILESCNRCRSRTFEGNAIIVVSHCYYSCLPLLL